MFHKHLTFIALKTMKIIVLLIICSWHPSYAVETGAVESPKAYLPSLTILFDTSILGKYKARDAAVKMVEEIGGNKDVVIRNYTLVPFGRDHKYEPIITPDVNSTKAAIEKMKTKPSVHSADAFYALEKCLSESHPPNPFIIMIADSSPRDDQSVTEIVAAVNKTQTRIVFLFSQLTLQMQKYHPEMNDGKYVEIATASQGHISTYESISGVSEALKFVFSLMNVTYEAETEKPFLFFHKGGNTLSRWNVVRGVVGLAVPKTNGTEKSSNNTDAPDSATI